MDVYRITCAFGRGIDSLQPVDAIRQHTKQLPQLLTELSHSCKTIGGYGMGKCPFYVKFFDDSTIIYLDAEYSHSMKEGSLAAKRRVTSYPCFTKQGEISTLATVPNLMKA